MRLPSAPMRCSVVCNARPEGRTDRGVDHQAQAQSAMLYSLPAACISPRESSNRTHQSGSLQPWGSHRFRLARRHMRRRKRGTYIEPARGRRYPCRPRHDRAGRSYGDRFLLPAHLADDRRSLGSSGDPPLPLRRLNPVQRDNPIAQLVGGHVFNGRQISAGMLGQDQRRPPSLLDADDQVTLIDLLQRVEIDHIQCFYRARAHLFAASKSSLSHRGKIKPPSFSSGRGSGGNCVPQLSRYFSPVPVL